MFKKGEFEKRLEEIGKKLRERVKLEEKVKEIESRTKDIEKKIEAIRFPKDVEEEITKLREEIRGLESRVESRIGELSGSIELLGGRIRKDVEKKLSGDIGTIVTNKMKESSQELLGKIDRLERKISEVENRMGKLLEILETVS